MALAVTALALGACAERTDDQPQTGASGATTQFPVTVGALTLTERPDAIVSLSPTATEMLFAIGAGGQVTAVDDNSNHPPEAPKSDLSGFQHLHPELDESGTWVTTAAFDEPGTYRLFADFAHEGRQLTLGADVTVAGDVTDRPLAEPADVATAGAYEVRKEADGERLSFTVTRDGDEVETEPYLGAATFRLQLLDAQRTAAIGADAHAQELGETLAFLDRQRAVVFGLMAGLDVEHHALQRTCHRRGAALARRKRRCDVSAEGGVRAVVSAAESADQLFGDRGFEQVGCRRAGRDRWHTTSAANRPRR